MLLMKSWTWELRGSARLKEKYLKTGVPIKQLQKYNKKDDEGDYSNASSETEKEDQPRKRRRLSSDAESSMSNVDVMSGTVHHVDSNATSEKHKKQEGTLSVKQSVTPVKQDQETLKTVCNSHETRSSDTVCKTVCNSEYGK